MEEGGRLGKKFASVLPNNLHCSIRLSFSKALSMRDDCFQHFPIFSGTNYFNCVCILKNNSIICFVVKNKNVVNWRKMS